MSESRKTFHPTELWILRRYLGQADGEPAPDDLWEDPTPDARPVDHVRLSRELGEDDAIANAVARICLARVQEALPSWTVFHGDGTVVEGRRPFATSPASAALEPRLLFAIDWGTSGPGYSWPEAYYVTHLPALDRYVVTASQDSDDTWGSTDQAIGHFPGSTTDVVGACKRVLQDFWRPQFREEGWEELYRTGLVDEKQATAWGEEVWGVGAEA